MLKKNFRILTALVLATALLCVLFPSLAEPETNGEEIRAETSPDAADGEETPVPAEESTLSLNPSPEGDPEQAGPDPNEHQIFVSDNTVTIYNKKEDHFEENDALTQNPVLEGDLNPVPDDLGDWNGSTYPALHIDAEEADGSFTINGSVSISPELSGLSDGVIAEGIGANATAVIKGDVTAESSGTLPNGELEKNIANGVVGNSIEGSSTVSVDGTVTATASSEDGYSQATGVFAMASNGYAETRIHIGGDVIAITDGKKNPDQDSPYAHGVEAYGENTGSTSVIVDGKVSATSTQPDLPARAISAVAINDPDYELEGTTADVTVGKGAEGQVCAYASHDGATRITIQAGGVTAVSGDNGAVSAYAIDSGAIEIDITGDVTAEDSDGLPGLAVGVQLAAKENGSEKITVTGGITAMVLENTEDSAAVGLLVNNEGSTVETVVTGDVQATGAENCTGIEISAGNGGKTEIIVDGTVSATDASVVLVTPETQIGENVTLTVWELVPNDNGSVVARREEGQGSGLIEDEAAEKAVQYIIRVNAGQQNIISTAGTQEYKGFNVAAEGDTVTLKLNIPAGFEIAEAFADKDQFIRLDKDASGNYFLTVPRGGAIELSVTMKPVTVSARNPAAQSEQKLLTVSDGGGTVSLTFFKNGTYRASFPDKHTEKGTFRTDGGVLVLVSASGLEMTADADGKLVYISEKNPDQTYEFRIQETDLDRLH